MMKLISVNLSRGFAKAVLDVKKNSPHIFFGAGVIGTVGSTVLACRATLKLEPTLDEIQKDIAAVKEKKQKIEDDIKNSVITEIPFETVERAYFKELTVVQAQSVLKLVRLYGPAILLGGAAIAALTGSHIQLTRRNSALTATLAAVSKAYEDYRARVREELGEEAELNIYRNIKDSVDVTTDGKKEKVAVVDEHGFSPYARVFDESSIYWKKNSEYNRIFVQVQQDWANQRLNSRGYLFLNEVYEMLGFEHTKPGQIVGWVCGSKDGDNHVDFGIFEAINSRFVADLERNVWLDFNVDGDVLYILEGNPNERKG